MPRHVDSNRVCECWVGLMNELGQNGRELKTWSLLRPRELPFKARAKGNVIVVEGPRISPPRIITIKEFECTYKLYNGYIDGVTGIRQKIRDKCGFNSSYIITLIHQFCQKM